MTAETRILVADDDPLVRDAYRAFFARQEGLTICAEARDGREAVTLYSQHRPDVVLMDLQMPTCSGIDAIGEICGRWPDACIVALTTFGSREYIVAALRAGASGYLLKDAGGAALVAGIRQAVAGEMPLSSSVRRELVTTVVTTPEPAAPAVPDVHLTGRERELLGWLAQGLTNQQIGARMYVSEGSVKQYLSHIGGKLGVKSRTQILIKSIQLGVVDPNEAPAAQA